MLPVIVASHSAEVHVCPPHREGISHFVAFLASEKSAYATDSSIILDGGLTLMGAQLGAG